MKLIVVIKSLAIAGGAERVLSTVASGLAERGHKVEILTFDRPSQEPIYPLGSAVHLIRLGVGDTIARTGPIEFARRLTRLRTRLSQDRPDVAIGFSASAYVALAAAGLGLGVPIVASEHTVYDHYRNRPLQRALIWACIPLLAGITAVSAVMRNSFPAGTRRKMTILPNPVGELANSVDPDGRLPTVLNVGRLDPEKGQHLLIAAFARIAVRHPDWRVRIFGEGRLRSALEQQVRASGLEDRIELCGIVSDLDSEYRSASIFAFPSLYESFGLATAEALARGLPGIGFADCPGTNELIEDEVNGILVDPADRVGNFSSALNRLMTDPALRRRMGEAAILSVDAFRVDHVLDSWEQFLTNIIAGTDMVDDDRCAA